MMPDPERAPRQRRLARLSHWLGGLVLFAGALTLVLVGFPADNALNQQWLRWTSGWHWPDGIPPARYQLSSENPVTQSQLHWPDGGVALELGPLFGPIRSAETALEPHWIGSYPAITRVSLPSVHLDPPRSATDRYWQPAEHGYKSLVYRTESGLVFDGQLSLFADRDHWRFQFGQGMLSDAGRITTDWRGGLLLASFAVPEPVLATEPQPGLPLIRDASGPGLQALREQWALENGFYVVEPIGLSVLAALMVVLPWIRPGLVGGHPVKLLVAVGIVVGLNLGLVATVHWWWPLWYPLVSVVLAAAWHRRLRKNRVAYDDLLHRYRTLGLNWLRSLLDQGRTEEGQRFLAADPDLTASRELTYELALGFERKRQYDQALSCLDDIARTQPDYRDIADRRSRLQTMVSGSQTVALGTPSPGLQTRDGLQAPVLGRYRIVREIGRGNMGVVYEAEDPKISRRVAIKVVHLEALESSDADAVKQRFFREAQAAGRLNHPGIVTVFDVGEEHDLAYIAMDRLQGQPLSQQLEGGSLPSVNRVCHWLQQAADALDFAHRHDIVHRDIKPANLFVDEQGDRLTITDFGVARIAGSSQTQTGIVLGSPSYMAPEQIRGEPLTGATDVFSLGVTLYQCLCGKLPFEGETLPALAYAITHSQQESPRKHNPDVPVALVRIVNKALKKNPAERYASAGEMAQALARWAHAGE